MSETDLGQPRPPIPPENETAHPGFLHLTQTPQSPSAERPSSSQEAVKPVSLPSSSAWERAGTVEHLAARRSPPPLDANAPEVKQRLSTLSTEITKLLTALRWEGQSVEETATRLLPLLNIGPFLQWRPLLIPFLLEIDRAGNFLPVWLNIIARDDTQELPPEANPAETELGRAKRIAILMLGNYKSVSTTEQHPSLGFSKQLQDGKLADITKTLARLAKDPTTSLYATQALVQQGTTTAMQALVSALPHAEGWAKVDIVEACLTLKQERFYDLLLASGLERVPGLESYVAVPLYRALPLARYLAPQSNERLRLSQQAALIVSQALQDSMTPPDKESTTLPVAFEQDLPAVARALFEDARSHPSWQNAVALHRLGLFLGHYWAGITHKTIEDTRIVAPVYHCLPMMPDVERWMAGPGRDVLLKTLQEGEEEAFLPVVRVLGELREPRAISPLIERVEQTSQLLSREHARLVGAACEALGRLGDRRAVQPMLLLTSRAVDTARRKSLPRRSDNLPQGDADIPASIVYGAIVRACGLLGDSSALEQVTQATQDFDPFVRAQALEALKTLDATGNALSSRLAARQALDDPRESIVRAALQLILQYRDLDALPTVRTIIATRPALAAAAYDALRQLGH